MLALALVVGLLGLVTYQNYWRARQLAVRAKQLELEALQARIRPHFLFNTLNTGAALVHARPADAERVLLDLADLFRCALRGPQQIPLVEELALTRRYLEIESLRFGDRLRLHWESRRPCPRCWCRRSRSSRWRRTRSATASNAGRMAGPWMWQCACSPTGSKSPSPTTCPAPPGGGGGHAVGLASARERVHALTDGRGRIESRVEGGRYIASVHLPLA
jgi:two-component system sensor histidine kinase AlgZ